MVAENPPPRASDADATEDADGHDEPDGQSSEDPIKVLMDQLGALSSYTGHFAQARMDGVKVRVRQVYARALAGLVAVLVIGAAATTGTVYVVHGMALALTAAFGGRASLGYMVAGVICVVGVIGVSVIGIRFVNRRRRHEIAARYEQRRSIERSLHGRDIDQAAEEAA